MDEVSRQKKQAQALDEARAKRDIPADVRFAALCFCGGITGIYGVNMGNHVFANAQTGNLVAMAQDLHSGSWGEVALRLGAVAMFVLGTLATVRVPQKCFGGDLHRWKKCCLTLETLLFVLQGALDLALGQAISTVLLLWPIFLASAMQYNTFNQLDGVPVATVFSTNNLRQVVLHGILWRDSGSAVEKRITLNYLMAVFCFFAGALAGAWLCDWAGGGAIFVCAGITVLLRLSLSQIFVRPPVYLS